MWFARAQHKWWQSSNGLGTRMCWNIWWVAVRCVPSSLPSRPSLPIEATKNTNESIYYPGPMHSSRSPIQSKSIPDVLHERTNERRSEINKTERTNRRRDEMYMKYLETNAIRCNPIFHSFARTPQLLDANMQIAWVCVCVWLFFLSNFIRCTVSVVIITWQYVKQKPTRKMTQTAVVVARCSARVHQPFIYRTLVARTHSANLYRELQREEKKQQRETDARQR